MNQLDQNFAVVIPTYGDIQVTGIPQGSGKVGQLIVIVVYILILLGAVLSISFLLFGAIKWITSGGDKQKLEEARKTVTYSIIGLIVIISALVIVTILGGILQAPFIAPPRLP